MRITLMNDSKIGDSKRLPTPANVSVQTRRRANIKGAAANLAGAFAKLGRSQAEAKDGISSKTSESSSAPPAIQTTAAQPMREAFQAPSVPGQSERDASALVATIKHLTLAAGDKQVAVQQAPLSAFAHVRPSDNKLAIEAATESFAYAAHSDMLDRMITSMMVIERTLQASAQSAPSRQRIKAGMGRALEVATKMAPERRAMLSPFLAQAYVQAGGDAQLHDMTRHVAQAADPIAAARAQLQGALRRGLGKDAAKAKAFMQDPGVQDFLQGGEVDLALMGMARKQGIAVPANLFGRDKQAAHALKLQLASISPVDLQKNPELHQLAQAVDRVVDAMDQGKKATLDMLHPTRSET